MNKTGPSDSVILLAILHFLIAIPGLLVGLVILTVPVPAVIMSGAPDIGLFFPLFGLGIAAVATGGTGAIAFVTGMGLLGRQDWARLLAIVFAVLMLLAFPLGTFIGAIALVLLFQDNVREEFATPA